MINQLYNFNEINFQKAISTIALPRTQLGVAGVKDPSG